jgi:hypothetical protein
LALLNPVVLAPYVAAVQLLAQAGHEQFGNIANAAFTQVHVSSIMPT